MRATDSLTTAHGVCIATDDLLGALDSGSLAHIFEHLQELGDGGRLFDLGFYRKVTVRHVLIDAWTAAGVDRTALEVDIVSTLSTR